MCGRRSTRSGIVQQAMVSRHLALPVPSHHCLSPVTTAYPRSPPPPGGRSPLRWIGPTTPRAKDDPSADVRRTAGIAVRRAPGTTSRGHRRCPRQSAAASSHVSCLAGKKPSRYATLFPHSSGPTPTRQQSEATHIPPPTSRRSELPKPVWGRSPAVFGGQGSPVPDEMVPELVWGARAATGFAGVRVSSTGRAPARRRTRGRDHAEVHYLASRHVLSRMHAQPFAASPGTLSTHTSVTRAG
ncbi:hypothetical protein EV649_3925 [Kribbella sp. VKM Ac-2569]|nr:hypothetical protein EV649_3925 [Kribbella sp. VKM Ac-2569]